jgi:hypothetical protein
MRSSSNYSRFVTDAVANPVYRAQKRLNSNRGLDREWPGLMRVDQNRRAAGPQARFDVSPPIADHVAGCQIDPPVMRSCDKQARLRLPAIAEVVIVVVTDADVVYRHFVSQPLMDRLNDFATLRAPRNVGLVRDYDPQEAERA